MRACIFCGSTQDKLTAEHLFGNWISRAFQPERKQQDRYRLWHQNLTGKRSEWRSASIDQKARLLCPRCNNEWSSELENEVLKPLIEPLMLRGRRTVLRLEDQLALSAWIVKTMIFYNHMWDSANPEHLFYSDEQRYRFRETLEPPDGVIIWLARFLGETPTESAPIIGKLSGYEPRREELRNVRTYVLTFSLRQFAVQMLAVKRLTEDAPSLDWLIKFFEPTPMWQPATIRIWPDPRKEIVWPPRATMPREAMQALADRYGSEFDLWPDELVPIAGRNVVPFLLEHDSPASKTKRRRSDRKL